MDFLNFVAKLGTELFELYQYSRAKEPDPEYEKQLAARIIRRSITIQAEQEISNG